VIRRRALFAVLALSAGLAAAVACTAFDDVPAPGSRAVPPEAGDETTADADAPDVLPAPGLLSLTEAAQLCSLIARCEYLGLTITAALRVPVAEPSYSLCLTELSTTFEPKRPGRDLTARVLKEIAAAPTCAAAASMLTLEVVPPGDARCASDGGDAGVPAQRCLDEKTALYCNGPQAFGKIRHCGKPNHTADETCIAFDGGVDCAIGMGCGGAGCIGPVLTTCRPSDAMRVLHTNTDCNVIGMQCTVGPDLNVGCSTDDVKTRQSSDGLVGAACRGSKRISSEENYYGETDCAAFGATCISSGVGATCAFPTDECSPFGAATDTCTGTTFHGCVAGKKTSVDCASIGKSCVLGSTAGYAVACE
jgi:hypothetical protein